MHDLFYMAKEEGLTSSHNFIALFLQDEIFITAMHRFILVLTGIPMGLDHTSHLLCAFRQFIKQKDWPKEISIIQKT